MDVEYYQRLFLFFASIEMIIWFLYFFVHVFGLLHLFLIYVKKIKSMKKPSSWWGCINGSVAECLLFLLLTSKLGSCHSSFTRFNVQLFLLQSCSYITYTNTDTYVHMNKTSKLSTLLKVKLVRLYGCGFWYM